MKKELPSQDYLNSILEYRDGLLYWKVKFTRSINIGDQAGNLSKRGYIVLGINKKSYLLHIIVWKMLTGNNPEFEIDHINRNKTDNRIENLRDGTNGINQRNKSKYKNNNDTPNIMKIGKKFYFRIHNLNNKRETHICNSLLEAEQLRTIKFEEYGYTKNHNLI